MSEPNSKSTLSRGAARHPSGDLTADRINEQIVALAAEKQALSEFTAAMENEFLALGTALRTISSLARQVRGRADEVIAASSGRTEDAAIQFAFQLLKKAEDLVHACSEQYKTVLAVFDRIQDGFENLAHQRSGLETTLFPLGLIKTQFRIQSCAFDDATREEFSGLAVSLGELIKDVRTAVGEKFEHLARTQHATDEFAVKLAATLERQKRGTEKVLAEVRCHLSALNAILDESHQMARSLSQAGEGVASGVGKAIVALQCQDMARQRFQHIGEAIDEMVHHLQAAGANGLAGGEANDWRRYLADAGRIQLGQLRAVFKQLEAAARALTEGFKETQSAGHLFAERAVRCGGAALDSQIASRSIESVRQVLAVIGQAVDNMQTVIGLIGDLKSAFGGCTSQLVPLTHRLQFAAMNARISADQLHAGKTLEVLAEMTNTIAKDAMLQFDALSSSVTELIDSIVNLEQRLADYRELAVMEQEVLANEAGESAERLGALEDGLRRALTAIRPLERELSAAIHQGIEQIRFPAAVATAGRRSQSLFEQILGEYSDAGKEEGEAGGDTVQALKRNYTMSHERVVHEWALAATAPTEPGPAGQGGAAPVGGGLGDSPPAPPAEVDGREEKLADNVELF